MAGFWEAIGHSLKGAARDFAGGFSDTAGGITGGIGNAGRAIGNAFMTGAASSDMYARSVYDMATAAFDPKKDLGPAWNDFKRANQVAMKSGGYESEALGHVIDSNAITSGLAKGAEWAYREGVSRPVSSAILQSDLARENEDGNTWHDLFDADAWTKAYDLSKTVSPGQALAGQDDLFGERWGADKIAQGVQDGAFDEGPLKWTSGTADFTLRTFADPTMVGGKALGAARLRYVKPLTQEKVLAGGATKYSLSGRFDRAAQVVKKADSADEVRVRLLNDNANGAAVASVLFAVRHDDELLRIATRAAHGEPAAYDDLAAYNKALIAAKTGDPAPGIQAAADLGRLKRGDKAIVRRQRIGTDGEELGDWDDYVALMKTDQNVFDQAVTLSDELMLEVKNAPLTQSGVTALPVMRDSLTSRMRFSLHQAAFSSAQPSLTRAPLESIMKTFLIPSNRRIHGIDLVDDSSDKALRSYLDRAGMPREQATKLLDRYMAATGNPSQRMLVMAQAEEQTIRHVGEQYGYSPNDVNDIVQKASEGAGRARYILANKHEFMAEDVKTGLADEGRVNLWIDEDGTRHTMAVPALESQLMDVYPVADPSQLHSAMKAAASPSFAVGQRVVNDTSAVLDSVHRLWKPTVLLGLGWPVRALSDEVGRSVALFGLMSHALGVGKGLVHSKQNAFERGNIRFDAYVNGQNRDRMNILKRVRDKEVPADARFSDLNHGYAEGYLSTKEFTDTGAEAAKRGLGDPLAAGWWRAVEDGVMTRAEFDNHMVTRALSNHEKNWYANPYNQRGILEQAQAEGYAHIDPTTGEIYKQPRGQVKLLKSTILNPAEDIGAANDGLYDFVREHLDDMLHRDGGITLKRLDDGTVKVDAYGPKVGLAQRRQIAKRGIKEFFPEKARAGNSPVRVKLSNGETMQFDGVLEDRRYLKMASGDDVYNNWMAEQHELSRDRIAASAGWSDAIKAGQSPDYPAAWERAVNLQLGNDRAAQQFLAGLDFDSVKHWATEPGGDGANWARTMAFTGDIDTRLHRVQAMVESYVPDNPELRKKVLAQKATYDDLHDVVPNHGDKPMVHGELLDYNMGGLRSLQMVRKQTHKLMEKLGTIPGDQYSRYPFLDKAYRQHIDNLAKLEFGQRGSITSARRAELQEAARKRALADVKKWLYNSDMVSEGSSLLRHMAPFAAAWQDGMRAWSGIAFRERPQTAGYIYNLWNSPERAGLVVDQDGRELRMEGGKEVWLEHEIDPVTGKETGKVTKIRKKDGDNADHYIAVPLPSWLTPDQLGGPDAKVQARVSKQQFNTFMHLDPGAGPVVTVPTSYIVQTYHPEWSESDIVKRILPYGPSNSALKNAMSNELRQVYENWKGEDDATFRNQTMAIYQTEAIKFNRGERATKPTMDEAASKATSLKLMRTVMTSVLPVSPNFMSPYQAHIDAYKQLQAADSETADQKFHERYGDDFTPLLARVTKGLKGLPPTMEAYTQIKKYRDLIEQHPEIAGAIVGDVSGSFHKGVYEWQKQERITTGKGDKFRELMDLRDSVEDAERRVAWMKYQDVADIIHAELSGRGESDVNAKGNEDLKDLQDGIVSKLGFDETGKPTKWFEDYSGANQAKKATEIASLRIIAQDKTLLNREDIQGLADYFIMRDEFKAQLADRGETKGGAKTLEAKKNADLADMWQQAVFGLKDQNLTFARLYDRYLTNDDLKV